jgi:hypothetical protein
MMILTPEQATGFWNQLAPRLIRAVPYANDGVNIDEIFERILKGTYQVWIELDENYHIIGVMLTEIIKNKNKTILFIYMYEANNLQVSNNDNFEILSNWAKGLGVDEIQLYGRAGWERPLKPFGFEKTHVLLRRRL